MTLKLESLKMWKRGLAVPPDLYWHDPTVTIRASDELSWFQYFFHKFTPLLPSFLNLDYDVCSTKCKYESWPFRHFIWFWTTCLCSAQCKYSFNFTFVSLKSTFTAIWHQHTNTQENNLCHHFFTTYMTTLESRAGLRTWI